MSRVLERMSAIMGPSALALDIVEGVGIGETGGFGLGVLVGFEATLVLCDLDVRVVDRGRQRMDEADACSCDETSR